MPEIEAAPASGSEDPVRSQVYTDPSLYTFQGTGEAFPAPEQDHPRIENTRERESCRAVEFVSPDLLVAIPCFPLLSREGGGRGEDYVEEDREEQNASIFGFVEKLHVLDISSGDRLYSLHLPMVGPLLHMPLYRPNEGSLLLVTYGSVSLFSGGIEG